MSNLNECPHCGREAKESVSSNWFPVHTCEDCGEKYCNDKDCGGDDEPTCPECGSTDYADHDKVYSN